MESPTGKALFTISPVLGYVFAALTVVTSVTLPAMTAGGVAVPAWVPILCGSINAMLLSVAVLGAGARTKAEPPPVAEVKP